ncbi:hypothetical protein BDA99DRAFT_558600 [Phascolomyces articulosus]|uniref:Uncharacterized protein n=1 Tax=Phascolomyces articulosus TaxID=60185 RepID=A0AAD5K2D4_9FUNG|nr:hypothetical protein BDA99DRAFT_558600 [Phascolomyces articulosus]
MFSTVRRIFLRIPQRAYALWAELFIIPLSYLTFHLIQANPTYAPRFGDFYTYLTLGGLIALWSVFGVIVTWKRSRKGVKTYLYGLVILNAIQICFGIVHIILLFTLYRERIIGGCYGIESDHFFWTSLGYSDDDETQALTAKCLRHWSKFAVQRTLTWAVFSILLVLSTVLINRYYIGVLRAHRHEIQVTTDWPYVEDNKPMTTIMRGGSNAGLGETRDYTGHPLAPTTENLPLKTPPPGYWEIQQQQQTGNNSKGSDDIHQQQHPHSDNHQARQEHDYFSLKTQCEEDDAMMYRRRDRLYSEISRVRDHKSQQYNQLLQSGPPTPSASGEGSIHPLDLRRKSAMLLAEQQRHLEEDDIDEYEYQPPSPPPPRGSISSDPMPSSSEKMDYDLYRSRPHRLSVIHGDQSETITMSRRRNKPQWFQEEHQTLLDDNDGDGVVDDTVNLSDRDSDYTDTYEYTIDSGDSNSGSNDDDDYKRAHLKD